MTTKSSVQTGSASVEPQTLGEWLDLAETNLVKRDYFAGVADFILDRINPEDFEDDPDSLLLGECERGQFVRRVERLRRWRKQITAPMNTGISLTVEDLAVAVGFTTKKTYRWLGSARFPGVLQPGGAGTEYYIPADTPERFRNQQANTEEE